MVDSGAKYSLLPQADWRAIGLVGCSSPEHLRAADGTVRNHVSAILGKLDVGDRTQAALLALRFGLVESDSGR
jgi:hypothetical protein